MGLEKSQKLLSYEHVAWANFRELQKVPGWGNYRAGWELISL